MHHNHENHNQSMNKNPSKLTSESKELSPPPRRPHLFALSTVPRVKVVFDDRRRDDKAQMAFANHGHDCVVWKVRCTSNELFTFRPAMGVLEPGQRQVVLIEYNAPRKVKVSPFKLSSASINRQSIERRQHYLKLGYIFCPDGCQALGAWMEHFGPVNGVKQLCIDWRCP